ncbi:MAG: hypothetical protein A2289_22385 [Deltaproteobacteria bacterium RIFOXYA12_FULL_58_15]|nr:MAG: hypothetical protein A2289_22385 [Deltaproteobacteria bacterium RIFOXYA12_FULL_58_15]OGR09637.1 MAG: hypothetical protein A2341_00295 [Deltaproteobacteria bacterium RIFOXYB12_FULL_58_9]
MALIAGLVIAGKLTGVTDNLSPEWVRDTVRSAGVWGYILYVVVFVLAELAQVPGWMFIAAGTLAYGRLVGFIFAYIASIASVATGFALVRWVGGQPLVEIKQRHAKILLSKLDERPILVVFLIRLVFWIAPPLNYALALTKIRFRDYMIGSVAGLILPVFGLSFLFEWVIGYFEGG